MKKTKKTFQIYLLMTNIHTQEDILHQLTWKEVLNLAWWELLLIFLLNQRVNKVDVLKLLLKFAQKKKKKGS